VLTVSIDFAAEARSEDESECAWVDIESRSAEEMKGYLDGGKRACGAVADGSMAEAMGQEARVSVTVNVYL
jgi:hypothetical protein